MQGPRGWGPRTRAIDFGIVFSGICLKKIFGTGQPSRLGKERVLGIGAIGSGW